MSKQISLNRATCLVAGNMIGSGILLAPGILAPFGNWALIGWILTSLGALSLALIFSKLSIWIPKSGGPYTYIKHVFGEFIGFQMAWGYWISAWCGSASLVIGALQYISIFFPIVASNQYIAITLGLSMILLFTSINLRGLKTSTQIEIGIVCFKILPLIFIAAVGIFFVSLENLAFFPDLPDEKFSYLGKMAPALLWSFIGLESATIPANHIDNPNKTIPLATTLGVSITAILYILGAIVITGIIPHEKLILSFSPYVDAATILFGQTGRWIMIIAGIIGIAGSINGWILIQGQVSKSAADENIFPKLFSKTNKFGVPYGVQIGSTCMALLFLFSYQESFNNQIKILIEVSVFAVLLPYFYSVMAALCIFYERRKKLSKSSKIVFLIIFKLAFLYTFGAIFFSGMELISIGSLIFLFSVPFYVFVKKDTIQTTINS